MTAPDWPDDAWLLSRWPQLGSVTERTEVGSGLCLTTGIGPVHLRRRAHSRVLVEVWVLAELTAAGLPVTVPLPAADGRAWAMDDADALLLYRELPGDPIVVFEDALDLDTIDARCEALGRACAHLGAALGRLDVATALAHGLPVRPNPKGCAGLTPQIVHRDFHAANVLFVDDRVSGYLDFDHLELAPRVVDLAYCAGSALARLFDGRRDQWLRVVAGLARGYQQVTPLSEAEVEALPVLVEAIEEDFAIWCASVDEPEGAQLSRALAAFAASHADAIRAAAR